MNTKEIILKKLQDGEASCFILQAGQIVYEGEGRGVSPLIHVYRSSPALLRGAFVFDKIVGKAAAVVLVLAGVSGAHGELMSESAYDFLCAHGIEAQYARRVPHIMNRRGDGLCPLEGAVQEIDTAEKAYEKLLQTIESLQKNTAKVPEAQK